MLSAKFVDSLSDVVRRDPGISAQVKAQTDGPEPLSMWRHHGGMVAQVLTPAVWEGTLQPVVVYRSCERGWDWIRPLVTWQESLPRFRPVQEGDVPHQREQDAKHHAQAVLKELSSTVRVGSMWRHYKGHRYRVLFLAVHEGQQIPAVVYKQEHGWTIWARPIHEWLAPVARRYEPLEEVKQNGQETGSASGEGAPQTQGGEAPREL